MNETLAEGLVTSHLSNGVATLRLGAAPAHALSLGVIRAMTAQMESLRDDPAVRVILIYSEGRIFCAGHDLKEIRRHRADADDGRAYVETLFQECSAMMIALARMPQPTIAVVEGVATAGGLQLMCSCDMAFASPDARFCLPGVNNGGFCTTPAVAVGRKLARNHLLELSMSGAMFTAEWAFRTGLINRIVPGDSLLAEAQAFAETLTKGHAPAMTAGKAMLYQQLDQPLEQAYAMATPTMIDHFMDPHRVALERD